MPSPYSWLLLLVRFGIKLSFVTGNTLRPHHPKSQVSWRSKGGKPPNWYVYLGTENPVQFPPWKRTAANPSKPAFHPHHILICIYLFHIVSYYEYYHPLNSNQNIILLQHYDTKIISSYTFSPSASNPPRGRHRPWAPGGCLRWAPATNRWIPVASLPHAAPGPGSAPKRRRCERTRTSRSRSPSPGRDRDFLGIRTVCFRESLGFHGKLSRNHGIVFQPSKFHWGAIFSPYFWRGYLQEKDGRVLSIVNQTNHRNGILSWARNRNPPKIHRFVSFVRWFPVALGRSN